MNITEVNIYPSDKGTKLKAYASIVIEDSLVIKDIKIIEGVAGLFIAMPFRKLNNGRFKDIAHPINEETRTMFTNTVIKAYKETCKMEASSQKGVTSFSELNTNKNKEAV